jgi:tRNA threonylcarbamoyladenosine biosynthesis protein TsaB
MLLLATDTSGKYGSIALANCKEEVCKISEVVSLEGGTFSAQLVPQISALLEKYRFTKQDIGAFAVAFGPGSFTGLRVGLAAIKALAEVIGKPIAAVSLLEAVAASASAHGNLMAALDAGRNEIYLGEYTAEKAGLQTRREWLASREECFAAAGESTLVTPNENLAAEARNRGLRVEQVDQPRSDMIARLGWRKVQRGETISPLDLDANYIRRSDAEIFSGRS